MVIPPIQPHPLIAETTTEYKIKILYFTKMVGALQARKVFDLE